MKKLIWVQIDMYERLNYNHNDADYAFKVNYTKSAVWEKEFNDEYSAPNEISLNKDVYGTLMTDWDVDWYKFNVPNDCTATFTLKHDKRIDSGGSVCAEAGRLAIPIKMTAWA